MSTPTSSSVTPKSCRGPYRRKKRTPRQTRHNRIHRLNFKTQSEPPEVEKENEGQTLTTDDLSLNFPESTDMNHEPGSTDMNHEPGSTDMNHEPGSTDTNHEPGSTDDQSKIFQGSLLTSGTSNLVISSFISRHHLSRQAQEDLLKLMHLHVPENSSLSSSLHRFKQDFSLADSSQYTHPKMPCEFV